MKVRIKENIVEEMMKEMAVKAVKEGKTFEYMMYWTNEPAGWQKKAKQYLQKAIREA